jgi:predicted regulator of Ras-like GTPase activity (Roadblock/LC7/MglB family)
VAYSTSSPAGKAVQNIIDELPGLMAVAIVEISSGMALASHSNGSINPETAAAYNTEVVKQKQKAMTALKLNNDERIDDILITLTNQIHLINLLADGKKFIYLVVNSRDTNLAIARDVLRRQSEILL